MPTLKINEAKVIDVQDWDDLVEEVYKRPYSFQQQNGCKERGVFQFRVPGSKSDFENDTVIEEVNGPEEGVSFKAWLARDPNQKLSNPEDQADYCLRMWWERNFYPDVEQIINDLHTKGLLPEGKYMINIDW